MPLRTARRWGLYGLLGGWLGLTVFQQADRPHWLQSKVDPTAMAVPNWRFFAPTPGRHDFNILVRNRLPDGSLTPWREHTTGVPRTLTQMVWHPARRMEKAVFDAISQLFDIADRVPDPRHLQVAVPYLALLNYITHQPDHRPTATALQFMIAHTAGYDETVDPKFLFLSEWHALAPAG